MYVSVWKQLSAAYNEQMDEMSSWMSVGRYYHRMMQCIADQIEHQLHVSWYTYQPQAADEQLTLVLDAPHVDDDHASAVGTSPVASFYSIALSFNANICLITV